jgi:hypothetical protein
MPKSDFFAKIPNDDEGKYFLFLLEKYLNKESYLIKKRGRFPNHDLMEKDGLDGRTRFWQHVPAKYALAFNLYLCVRRENMCPAVVGISTHNSERKRWEDLDEQRAVSRRLSERIQALECQKMEEKGIVKRTGERSDFEPRYQHLEKKL